MTDAVATKPQKHVANVTAGCVDHVVALALSYVTSVLHTHQALHTHPTKEQREDAHLSLSTQTHRQGKEGSVSWTDAAIKPKRFVTTVNAGCVGHVVALALSRVTSVLDQPTHYFFNTWEYVDHNFSQLATETW